MQFVDIALDHLVDMIFMVDARLVVVKLIEEINKIRTVPIKSTTILTISHREMLKGNRDKAIWKKR